jgi:hypothetical protein
MDHMIAPDAERAMARTMKAHVIELNSSHVSMLSHPDKVTAVIEDALASATLSQMANAH